MSGDSRITPHSTRVVILVGFTLLVLGLVTVAIVTGLRSRSDEPQPSLTASPLPTLDESSPSMPAAEDAAMAVPPGGSAGDSPPGGSAGDSPPGGSAGDSPR